MIENLDRIDIEAFIVRNCGMLRKIRRAADLTQKWTAAQTETHQNYISNLECGKVPRLKLETLKRILRLYLNMEESYGATTHIGNSLTLREASGEQHDEGSGS